MWPLASIPGRMLVKLSGADAPLTSVKADGGSVAIGRDNSGVIITGGAQFNLIVEQQVRRELPSYLSNVVMALSDDLMGYGAEAKRELLPEVVDKLKYNDFPARHRIITDYTTHLNLLDATYRGVEQRNGDARRMVRRRAAKVYQEALLELCESQGVHHSQVHELARKHAVLLVRTVIATLMNESEATSLAARVMEETADLAISLIVADAVVECEVLERPDDATAA
jgi:hypothetical protein